MGQDDGGSGLFHRDRLGWRSRLSQSPAAERAYRALVGCLGGLIAIVGLIMVPLPGPGWLVVFIGVALIGTEFERARRLHQWGWGKVQSWARWLAAQSWWVRAGVATATFCFVTAVVWLSLRTSGMARHDLVPPALRDIATQYFFL